MSDIVGREYRVLDDGFVRVVDTMGDDAAIVQAARVSYGEGTKTVRSDRGLIRYLMRHRHTSPFEMCEIKFHVRVPMDVWRQWIRHRTASVNEYSTRYSEAIDSAHTAAGHQWRMQAADNKQGSSGLLEPLVGKAFTDREKELHTLSREVYKERLAAGIAREQARKDLPLSTYTEAYWKIDLHNLFHFLKLRMDSHAQLEIRSYADAIADLVSLWVPASWEAFEDYVLHSVTLSTNEQMILSFFVRGYTPNRMLESLHIMGWVKDAAPTRELREFEEKLRAMGMISKWKERYGEIV